MSFWSDVFPFMVTIGGGLVAWDMGYTKSAAALLIVTAMALGVDLGRWVERNPPVSAPLEGEP